MKGTTTYNERSLVIGISKTEADEHDARVDEKSDENAGCDDLGIRILVFI